MLSSAKGNREEVGLEEIGGGVETGRSGGRKIVVGMDCMREESILNLKRKEEHLRLLYTKSYPG